MARLTGFEPVTTCLEGRCSIQLSYRRIKKSLLGSLFKRLVGATGFEPTTPCSQSRCSTKLSYAPTLPVDIEATASLSLSGAYDIATALPCQSFY